VSSRARTLPRDSPKAGTGWSVVTFFVLTYAFTWACWIPVVTRATSSRSSFFGFLWLVGVFGPALVALALTARRDGISGVKALLGRMLRWQVGAKWYVFAISYMAAIKLAAAIAHRLTTGSWPPFGAENPALMLGATLLSTPVQSGEEIGWRGYALPRLAERMGFACASLLLGIFWALWHLPQFFLAGADTYRQPFLIWAIEVVALSVAIAWLYARTNGSLLLTMLMHAAINNTKDIVPSGTVAATSIFSLHASSITYFTTALLWITVAYFLLRMPHAASLDLARPAS
jgi:uncharacterized protein